MFRSDKPLENAFERLRKTFSVERNEGELSERRVTCKKGTVFRNSLSPNKRPSREGQGSSWLTAFPKDFRQHTEGLIFPKLLQGICFPFLSFLFPSLEATSFFHIASSVRFWICRIPSFYPALGLPLSLFAFKIQFCSFQLFSSNAKLLSRELATGKRTFSKTLTRWKKPRHKCQY